MYDAPPIQGSYGPKMMALPNDRWRRFVLELMGQAKRDYSAAYIAAGYSSNSAGAVRVEAHRMAHDQRIQEAIQEEGARRMKALLPAALHVVEQMLEDPQNKDAAKAAFGVMDRAGLAAATEHKITLGLANDTEMLARIKLLAERNGIPLATLLGERIAKTIEHVPTPELDPYADEEY
jgi:hypothetical protein